jgi:hypothetical protein
MAAIAPERPITHRTEADYNNLTPQQQIQTDGLLDLLDDRYGLTDTVQRHTVSLIAAQITGILLPPGDEIASCTDCRLIAALSTMHDASTGTRCDECHHLWALANDPDYTGR